MSVNIFISHRSEDLPTAAGIKDLLKGLDQTNDLLTLFLSEEMPQGEDWYQWIKKRLVESNLLLLLFTDVKQDWGWCLYEADLFDRLDEINHRRIICLHPNNIAPPPPLKHLQSVPAELSKVKLFLEQLYMETQLTGLPEPIAPWLVGLKKNLPAQFEEILNKKAQDIISLVKQKPIEIDHFCEYIFLHIRELEMMNPDQIPPDSIVTSSDSMLSNLFGLMGENRPWKHLEEQARQNKDIRWIDELTKAIYQVSRRKIFDPIKGTFYARKAKEIYCPILYGADWKADGAITFKILFYKNVSWQIEDIPLRQGNLLTSVIMATRFRYELLEK